MRFQDLSPANANVAAAMRGMVDSGRIPHAIMLHEDDGGEAFSVAMALLQYLFCTSKNGGDSCAACPNCNKVSKLIHPDIHFIYPVTSGNLSAAYAAQFRTLALENPCFSEAQLGDALGIEGKSSIIAVSEAKAVLDTLSLSALQGGWKAVVIYLPEKMNQEAANRLLKVIEEPPSQTEFILITHAVEKVLTTISSRCQRIRIAPVQGRSSASLDGQMGEQYPELLCQLMAALLSKNLLAALEAGENIAALPSRESAKGFCNFASTAMRGIFMLQQGLPQLVGSQAIDAAILRDWASQSRKTFPRAAEGVFSKARMLIERNVNVKIIFTDLVDRLFLQV